MLATDASLIQILWLKIFVEIGIGKYKQVKNDYPLFDSLKVIIRMQDKKQLNSNYIKKILRK